MRWSVERRLGFIEERLFWLGEINRDHLVRRFGVSMSQTSADIARYLALEPRISYDKSGKRYAADEDFRPVLGAPDARPLLSELKLIEAGILAESSLGEAPPFAATPVPERAVDAYTLRAILRAIRESRAVEIYYQSMSRAEPMRRIIEPHALAYDGFRWHARSFDLETRQFRDFVIGRMAKPRLGGQAGSRAKDDLDWTHFVDLQIAPHPRLARSQARAIALDYGIRGRSAKLRVRRALLFYALKRLGLDVSADIRPPQEQHIVLVNRAEVERALKRESEP